MTPPQVCIPNIGRSGRRLRGLFGWAALAATALLVVGAAALDAPVWLRLLVALPAFLGATGVLQAREKT